MAGKLAHLAAQIARIEADTSRRTETLPPVPLQCPAIDGSLPDGGLARGAVHEMMGPGHDGDQRGDGALMGFASVALARLMRADEHARPALWCMNQRLQQVGGLLSGLVYPPGLQMMGVPVERLLLAYTNNDADTLWAMEERGLRRAGRAEPVRAGGGPPPATGGAEPRDDGIGALAGEGGKCRQFCGNALAHDQPAQHRQRDGAALEGQPGARAPQSGNCGMVRALAGWPAGGRCLDAGVAAGAAYGWRSPGLARTLRQHEPEERTDEALLF